MIKDMTYYRTFDLTAASVAIQRLGEQRGEGHEVFGDAINTLGFTCGEKTIHASYLLEILGPPNRVKSVPCGEIWEYDWSSYHGPIKYASTTPFVIENGVLKGVWRDGEVL